MNAPLIYVVGASGSGKDSLLIYAREKLAGSREVIFAHRYITRSPYAGSENHIALRKSEYEARLQLGLFALNWNSHEFSYALGVEINLWLDKGITVVVNGSREYISEARRAYPNLLLVWIDVSAEKLRQRLKFRGRESDEEIERRLLRNDQLQDSMQDGFVICNDNQVEQAGEDLVDFIRSKTRREICV